MSDQDDADHEYEYEWQTSDDGTEFFVEDGIRYELAEDGYAYPIVVDPDDVATPEVDESAHAPERGTEAQAETETRKQRREREKAEKAAAKETAEIPVTEPQEASESRKDRKAREKAERQSAAADVTSDVDHAPAFSPDAAASATPTIQVREGSREASATGEPDVLLRLEGLKSGYGKLPVLHGVDFEIRRGETAVMLGLNGAGKTTTAMNIAGALEAWGGTISFEGQDITAWGTRECVSNGIVMVPEGRRVFPDLSVLRNLQVGAWSQRGEKGFLDHQREVVFDYFPRLRERTDQLAGTLSGGEQQMLAVGRGLMANPRMLIVDEASMGLAPVIVKDVFDIVAQISTDGVTVLLIEQNVGALEVADVGFVMEQGRLVRTLRGDELADRSAVTDILMG